MARPVSVGLPGSHGWIGLKGVKRVRYPLDFIVCLEQDT